MRHQRQYLRGVPAVSALNVREKLRPVAGTASSPQPAAATARLYASRRSSQTPFAHAKALVLVAVACFSLSVSGDGIAQADCWAPGARKGASIDVSFFLAGLNHLYNPDGSEAGPGIAVDEPIRGLASRIVAAQPNGQRLVVAVTGNKHTTNFPDNTNHPADRLQNLLAQQLPIGGSTGDDQFRLIYGSAWELWDKEWREYPSDARRDGFNGFLKVHLRPLTGPGGGWDIRTPDLVVFIFRPHVDNSKIRARQVEYLVESVRTDPILNSRGGWVSRPLIVGDMNERYPSDPNPYKVMDLAKNWTTGFACEDGATKLFGDDNTDSDLMQVYEVKPLDSVAFNSYLPAVVNYDQDSGGKPAYWIQAIKVSQLGHNVVGIQFQRQFDVPGKDEPDDPPPPTCTSGQKLCCGRCWPRNKPCPDDCIKSRTTGNRTAPRASASEVATSKDWRIWSVVGVGLFVGIVVVIWRKRARVT